MVSRYLEATQAQQSALRGGTEEVDIDAAVPKFQKHGKLHALRSISKLGKITYKALGFSGDNVVKTEGVPSHDVSILDGPVGLCPCRQAFHAFAVGYIHAGGIALIRVVRCNP